MRDWRLTRSRDRRGLTSRIRLVRKLELVAVEVRRRHPALRQQAEQHLVRCSSLDGRRALGRSSLAKEAFEFLGRKINFAQDFAN